MELPFEISAAETLELIQSGNPPLIIDVRDSDSYRAGHIPGAISNPMASFDMGMIPADMAADARIIISCYMGHASQEVASYLRQNGYTGAQSMKGGMNGWQRLENAPVER